MFDYKTSVGGGAGGGEEGNVMVFSCLGVEAKEVGCCVIRSKARWMRD